MIYYTIYIIHVVIQVSFSLKLFTGYKAIRQQLETSSHNNAKAEGYARLIGDGHVITYILKLKVYFTKLNIF